MAFKLGSRSRAELKGVHPDLVRVVERAIEITAQDFTVHDGLRTAAEQKALVAAGASQTQNSNRPALAASIAAQARLDLAQR